MSFNEKEKNEIINKLNPISNEEAINDFIKLRNFDFNKSSLLSNIGSDITNKFTQKEKLNTLSRKNISFFQFYKIRKEFLKEKYIISLFKYYNVPLNSDDIKLWYRIFSLYFGSIQIFKPTIAMYIYMKFKPKIILDMTMGWGGRLIGACALDIYKYIGIDNNLKLIEPYKKLEKILKPYTKTKIELYFGDALLFDYNKHEYDLVLTSPPYYNIEIYTNQEKRTKEEWNNNFYTPLFIKSFNGLKKGGYYCLNIPFEVYENVALKILGEPFEKILMPKNKRSLEEKYKEYIYIWKK